MSLLLDALKKAAEQKAQKSRQEDLSQRASDETLLEADAADISINESVESPLLSNDVTEFEHTDLRARLERGERIAGDDTGLDISDFTDPGRVGEQHATRTGEETGLDIPDATQAEPGDKQPVAKNTYEETGLDIPVVEAPPPESTSPAQTVTDETGLDLPEAQLQPSESMSRQQQGADETGLDVSEPEPAESEQAQTGEDTGLNLREDTGLEIPRTEGSVTPESDAQTLSDEDDTVVAPSEDGSDSGSDASPETRDGLESDGDSDSGLVEQAGSSEEPGPGKSPVEDDKTDLSVPVTSADQIESARPELPPSTADLELIELEDEGAGSDRVFTDEDLSLLLVDPDPTGPGTAPGFNDSQIAVDRAGTVADSNSPVDTTETRIPGAALPGEQTDTQGPTVTNVSQTAIHTDDTTRAHTLAAPTRSTVTRPADATSTRTYAPDNYDRTLMKLPSNDASQLFAGMKSDADVVMTPDYAKKVFRSKTSAQRLHHYKYYAGIGFVLLLMVAVFGGFEYYNESDQIDMSMRPLMRDPMPGKIKIPQPEETNLFADTDGQLDARTIELIETATDAPVADTVTSVDPDTEQVAAEGTDTDLAEAVETEAISEVVASAETTSTATTSIATVNTAVTSSSLDSQAPEAVPTSETDDAASNQEVASAQVVSNKSNLQIKTNNAFREVDVWLQEAYEAYQAGNLPLAMSNYNRVVEVAPGNRNALLGRAAISIQQGAIDAAIEDYQVLLLANPKDSLAMSSLLGVGSYSPRETESQLKLMIHDEPDSPYLNFALANAYGAQNRWQEAQGHYFTALQNNPADPNYAYNLAVSLEHISQPVSAMTYYRRALENINNGLVTFSPEVVGQRLEVLGKL